MKIIALQGKSNCGKTTVITKLYQKLCVSYKRTLYNIENNYGDFSAIFDIDGHIVGVTSIGDSRDALVTPFKLFEDNDCELCVVCCRKKHNEEGSKEFVEEKEKSYNTSVIWYTKSSLYQRNTRYNAGVEIDEMNDIQARILLKEILLQI